MHGPGRAARGSRCPGRRASPRSSCSHLACSSRRRRRANLAVQLAASFYWVGWSGPGYSRAVPLDRAVVREAARPPCALSAHAALDLLLLNLSPALALGSASSDAASQHIALGARGASLYRSTCCERSTFTATPTASGPLCVCAVAALPLAVRDELAELTKANEGSRERIYGFDDVPAQAEASQAFEDETDARLPRLGTAAPSAVGSASSERGGVYRLARKEQRNG